LRPFNVITGLIAYLPCMSKDPQKKESKKAKQNKPKEIASYKKDGAAISAE